MADNITLNTGSGGSSLATDEDASSNHWQKVKLGDGTADSTTVISAGHGTAANALRVELPTDGTGQVKIAANTASIGTVGLNTGTNSVGTVGLDAGSNLIGTVQGNVAHDASGTSIKPFLQGALAYSIDGTAPGTDVAEGDITRLKSSLDGRLLVSTSHPFFWSANDNQSTAQTNTELQAAPGASLSLYVTDVVVSSLTAQTTTIVSDGAGSPVTQVPIIYTGANGIASLHFDPPLKAAANKNFAYTTTAAVATSVQINGFTAA